VLRLRPVIVKVHVSFERAYEGLMSGRTPPASVEAEQSVLGGILLKAQAIDAIDQLLPEDFYDPRHQHVFRAMVALKEKSRPIDATTLAAELKSSEKLDAVGGLRYLGELAAGVPTAENIAHYGDIVKDKSIARELIQACSELAARGYGDYGEVREFMDAAEAAVFAITEKSNRRGGPQPIKELVKQVAKTLDARVAKKEQVTGLPTGFTRLDEQTSGLQPSDLIILAARPSMGKTALAVSIAQNAAIQHGYPCIIFSLEMSGTQLVERMIASEGQIESTSLRRGTLQRQDLQRLTAAASKIMAAPVVIDDTPGMSVHEVRSRCRRFRSDKALFKDKPFGLVVIDYLQLMRGSLSGGREKNREQEISEISRGLKALAKEIGCPVVALSQLNRDVEKRGDKRPTLADLRESGAIEQDADVILFIYRDEVYNKEATEKKGIAEVIIGKQRNGPIGTVELAFLGPYTRFENLSMRQDDY
jgi:replicative DNA helicase